ncbi:Imm1 family immunity protein [Sorangium sp. So ce1153]|uniref:Imm1 family immunity protein n=1 Tax=Sorangium sp. So ce1153 TaxID=3133333 RepID=UPI003F605317
MLLTWGKNQHVQVKSVRELDAILDQLAEQAKDYGMIVQATHLNGSVLALGLGREETVLTFFDQHGKSFTSVGDRNREDYLAFEFGGDVSEMMGAKAVPISAARSAARAFFECGEIPEQINWEQEWS